MSKTSREKRKAKRANAKLDRAKHYDRIGPHTRAALEGRATPMSSPRAHPDADPERPVKLSELRQFYDRACTSCQKGLLVSHPDGRPKVDACRCSWRRFAKVHGKDVVLSNGQTFWRKSYQPIGGTTEKMPEPNAERLAVEGPAS